MVWAAPRWSRYHPLHQGPASTLAPLVTPPPSGHPPGISSYASRLPLMPNQPSRDWSLGHSSRASTHSLSAPLGPVGASRTYILYTLIYHPFFCIMTQVSLGYWRSSLQCCYFHLRTLILGYGAPLTRRPGATGAAGSPRTLILGIRCPKHSLSFGPLMGSPRTSFSGS